MMTLRDFVVESFKIEGYELGRSTTLDKMVHLHETLLRLDELEVRHLQSFVRELAFVSGGELRERPGMDVRVGDHRPRPGGPAVREELDDLLKCAQSGDPHATPHATHHWYETLHPFMDGNGRSGRALWLWMHYRKEGDRAWQIGFLHRFYYESLQYDRAHEPLLEIAGLREKLRIATAP